MYPHDVRASTPQPFDFKDETVKCDDSVGLRIYFAKYVHWIIQRVEWKDQKPNEAI